MIDCHEAVLLSLFLCNPLCWEYWAFLCKGADVLVDAEHIYQYMQPFVFSL